MRMSKHFWDVFTQLFIGVGIVWAFFVTFWICATLHEIHLDLVRIGDILRDKQLEIPSPLWVKESR